MIFSELYDFRDFIVNRTKANCSIGDKDVGADEYPYIKLILENEFDIHRQNEKLVAINLPVSVKIIVAKGDEIKGLEVFERFLMEANQFNSQKGHTLEGTGSPEYVDTTKTFEINVLYNLNLLVQDS